MLFYNLISPIELKQGLIADKKLLTFVHTKKGARVSTLLFGVSCKLAVGRQWYWNLVLVCAPRISLYEGKITAEPMIFMAEIRDGRREKSL